MLNNSNRKSSELVRLCRGLTNQEVNGEGSKVNGEGFWLLRRHSEEGEARWWRKRKIGRPIGCRVSESPDSGIRHGVAGYFPPNFSLSLSVMPKASFCFHDWTGFNDAGGPLCNPCHNNCEPCCGEPCNFLDGLYCFTCVCCCTPVMHIKRWASQVEQPCAL